MTPNRQRPAPHFYLLGHAHAVLDLLLEAAIRPDDPTSQAATDPDFAAKRLGALFRLAFDGGLLQLPARGDGPPGANREGRHVYSAALIRTNELTPRNRLT